MINFHTATAAAITRNLRNTLTSDALQLTWGNAASVCAACDSGKQYALCNCPQAREEIAMALMAVADDFAGLPVEARLRGIAAKLMPAIADAPSELAKSEVYEYAGLYRRRAATATTEEAAAEANSAALECSATLGHAFAVQFASVEYGLIVWHFRRATKRDAVEAAQVEYEALTGNRLPLNRFTATRA